MSGARDYSLYVEKLDEYLRYPTEALDGPQLIRDQHHRTIHLSEDDTALFAAATKRISINKALACSDDYYPISGTLFTLYHKRDICNFFNYSQFLNSIELTILKNYASIWNVVLMLSVKISLIHFFIEKLHEQMDKNVVLTDVMLEEQFRAHNLERQKFEQQFIFPKYIRPELLRLISNAVVNACDNQLKNGLIPLEYRRIVRNIKNATKFSDDSFNGTDYMRSVNLLPLERTWARAIIGALLAAAGLVLAATALTFAVMTYGAGSPLSIAGMTVAMKLVMVGMTFAGVTGLTLACAGSFFANSRHADSEVAESAKLFHQYKMHLVGG